MDQGDRSDFVSSDAANYEHTLGKQESDDDETEHEAFQNKNTF